MPFVFRLLCAAGLVAVLAGCETTPEVNSDFNPSYQFAGKTRFAVLRPEKALALTGKQVTVVMNDLLAERITIAVENALVARGYQVVPVEQADLIASFYVSRENKTDIRTYNTGFAYGRCAGPYRCGAWGGPTEVDVRNYQEGTLLIDVFDAKGKTLEWRGSTSKRLPSKASRSERDALVKEVVDAIIAKYPQ
jgi:hypothetical protein